MKLWHLVVGTESWAMDGNSLKSSASRVENYPLSKSGNVTRTLVCVTRYCSPVSYLILRSRPCRGVEVRENSSLSSHFIF